MLLTLLAVVRRRLHTWWRAPESLHEQKLKAWFPAIYAARASAIPEVQAERERQVMKVAARQVAQTFPGEVLLVHGHQSDAAGCEKQN